jgi:hypothetical protein
MDNAARDYSEMIDEIGLTERLDNLAEIDLAALIATAEMLKSSASWVIGDVTNAAKEFFGDDWYQHIPFTVNIRTCNNYGSIAKKFPRDRRRKSLPFRYFDAVKALDPELQDEWLDKAEKQEMTSDQLRDSIRDIATVEKRVVIGHVGSIDKLLRLDMGLPENFEVKISYTIYIEQKAAA